MSCHRRPQRPIADQEKKRGRGRPRVCVGLGHRASARKEKPTHPAFCSQPPPHNEGRACESRVVSITQVRRHFLNLWVVFFTEQKKKEEEGKEERGRVGGARARLPTKRKKENITWQTRHGSTCLAHSAAPRTPHHTCGGGARGGRSEDVRRSKPSSHSKPAPPAVHEKRIGWKKK
jgi:hypothetical protein